MFFFKFYICCIVICRVQLFLQFHVVGLFVVSSDIILGFFWWCMAITTIMLTKQILTWDVDNWHFSHRHVRETVQCNGCTGLAARGPGFKIDSVIWPGWATPGQLDQRWRFRVQNFKYSTQRVHLSLMADDRFHVILLHSIKVSSNSCWWKKVMKIPSCSCKVSEMIYARLSL